jgi:hypothetical protein
MGRQIKLGLLKTGGVITAIAPLVTVIAINWNDYVMASNGNPLKLTMGGMIAVFLIACSTLGRLKMPGKTTFYFMLLVMVILLDPVLADLKLLCFCALGGEVLNAVTFNIFTKNYQETITMEKQAKITKNVFKNEDNKTTKSNGRV